MRKIISHMAGWQAYLFLLVLIVATQAYSGEPNSIISFGTALLVLFPFVDFFRAYRLVKDREYWESVSKSYNQALIGNYPEVFKDKKN